LKFKKENVLKRLRVAEPLQKTNPKQIKHPLFGILKIVFKNCLNFIYLIEYFDYNRIEKEIDGKTIERENEITETIGISDKNCSF
jgi:hypothetical protein